ncbi:fungal-specific transcription factor domain-containing protein [Aspergillus pseudoustus]|uniref:Fungal-specific transcription factor domain-containing protein n=1 Tax=Aspergillus pseudoustus TaxID=1810923 RepID=A0ABR4IKS9_9EURO
MEQLTPSSRSSGRATSSCAECRRRRIRCDGLTTPCQQCAYYQVPHLCHYPPRKARRNVSLRSHAELSDAHTKSQKIIKTLFPSVSLDELASMSRPALVAKAQDLLQESFTASIDGRPENDLRDLEPPPERDFTWDEVSNEDSDGSRVADDINGLAVSLDSLTPINASYLGFSSVPTILRVIAHLSPRVRQAVPTSPEAWKSLSVHEGQDSPGSTGIDELSMINAYFTHVHPITPMVDEVDFRQRYTEGGVLGNHASSWLALLNMVLAMGCFAADYGQFNKRHVLYKRALSHLSLSSLGSGHLYTVQALALYGGYLLHYLNKPNTASAILGATVRMAVAMGLHRVRLPKYNDREVTQEAQSSIITRIRTWWSIFCLDTWAAATLGRPGLGYWSPGTVLTSPTSSLASLDYGTISLAASEQFCKIATRVQERLAQMPLITTEEMTEFDHELLTWQSSLHMFLANKDHCPVNLRIARGLLRCRYITTRLALYRPYLLSAALHHRPWSYGSQHPQTSHAAKCVEIARDGVDMISKDWFPNHLLAWNDAWHLFQLCLVLILAVVSDRTGAERERCDEYITKALDLFSQMEHLDTGAMRSRLRIVILYDNIRNQNNTDSAIPVDAVGSSVLDFLDFDMSGGDTDWLGFFFNYNEET